MEIAIAIGLGLWFVVTGLISTVAVFRSFDEKKESKR